MLLLLDRKALEGHLQKRISGTKTGNKGEARNMSYKMMDLIHSISDFTSGEIKSPFHFFSQGSDK